MESLNLSVELASIVLREIHVDHYSVTDGSLHLSALFNLVYPVVAMFGKQIKFFIQYFL